MNSGTIAGLTSAPLKTKGWNLVQKTATSSGTVSWKSGLGAISQILGPADQELKINAGKSPSPFPAFSTAGKNLILSGGAGVKGADSGSVYGGSTYILAGDSAAEYGAYSGGFTSIKGGKSNGGIYGGEIIVWGGYGSGGVNGNTNAYGVSVTGSGTIFIGSVDSGGAAANVIIKPGISGGAGSTAYDGSKVEITSGSCQTSYAGMNPPGTGGPVTITAGNGGRASTGTGGTGGSVTITSGSGGINSVTNGNSGAITIATGLPGTGGTGGVSGSILFNTGSTNQITISPARTTITNEAKIERAVIVLNSNSTTATLNINDAGTIINCTSSTDFTINLPSTAMPVGYNLMVIQSGTGKITFAANTNTLNSFGGLVSTAGIHSAVSLVCTASQVYNLSGNLV